MTTIRIPLADDSIWERYDAAMDAFGARFAVAHQELMERYAEGGAQAVAEAAWTPGGPTVEQLAEDWERLVQRALKQARTAA